MIGSITHIYYINVLLMISTILSDQDAYGKSWVSVLRRLCGDFTNKLATIAGVELVTRTMGKTHRWKCWNMLKSWTRQNWRLGRVNPELVAFQQHKITLKIMMQIQSENIKVSHQQKKCGIMFIHRENGNTIGILWDTTSYLLPLGHVLCRWSALCLIQKIQKEILRCVIDVPGSCDSRQQSDTWTLDSPSPQRAATEIACETDIDDMDPSCEHDARKPLSVAFCWEQRRKVPKFDPTPESSSYVAMSHHTPCL